MDTTPFLRPEDRRRSTAALSPPAPVWADTVPACFRSEAFPEDLPPDGADVVLAPGGEAVQPS